MHVVQSHRGVGTKRWYNNPPPPPPPQYSIERIVVAGTPLKSTRVSFMSAKAPQVRILHWMPCIQKSTMRLISLRVTYGSPYHPETPSCRLECSYMFPWLLYLDSSGLYVPLGPHFPLYTRPVSMVTEV